MSKHGRAIICGGCGGAHPVNRQNLRLRKQPGGFRCPTCRSGKRRGRPDFLADEKGRRR